jgi:hypothetical protein
MKKQVTDYVKYLGGQTAYSGKTKTMYINDKIGNSIELKVLEFFGYGLPFGLKTN